jgi:hypothetical protein
MSQQRVQKGAEQDQGQRHDRCTEQREAEP